MPYGFKRHLFSIKKKKMVGFGVFQQKKRLIFSYTFVFLWHKRA